MTEPLEAADEDLLRSMSRGGEAAFAELYRRRHAAVYRFALHMSGSTALAEDVTQEVFLALIHGARGFDAARGTLASYLFGMARNLVLRALARRREDVPLEEEDAAPVIGILADLERREAVAAVRRAVLALPPHYREAIVLCELEELDYASAAAVLGCSIGTVRSRLHRARALLVERMRARPVRCS